MFFALLCLASPKSLSQQGEDGRVRYCAPDECEIVLANLDSIFSSPQRRRRVFVAVNRRVAEILSSQTGRKQLTRQKKGEESAALLRQLGAYKSSDIEASKRMVVRSGGASHLLLNIGATLGTGIRRPRRRFRPDLYGNLR